MRFLKRVCTVLDVYICTVDEKCIKLSFSTSTELSYIGHAGTLYVQFACNFFPIGKCYLHVPEGHCQRMCKKSFITFVNKKKKLKEMTNLLQKM